MNLDNVLIFRLLGAKPFSIPDCCQLEHKKHVSVQMYLQFKSFLFRKCIWKWRLQYLGHSFQASTYNPLSDRSFFFCHTQPPDTPCVVSSCIRRVYVITTTRMDGCILRCASLSCTCHTRNRDVGHKKNANGITTAVEVRAWMSNKIPLFSLDLIIFANPNTDTESPPVYRTCVSNSVSNGCVALTHWDLVTRQRIGSSLVHALACRLFPQQSLPEPMMT